MRGLDQFKSGFFRKLGYIAAAMLVAFVMGYAGKASATVRFADQGGAYAACLSAAKASDAFVNSQGQKPFKGGRCVFGTDGSIENYYNCRADWVNPDGSIYQANVACPVAETNFAWPIAKSCASRASTYAGFHQPGIVGCRNGCQYTSDPAPGEKNTVADGNSTAIQFNRGNWKTNGQTCADNDLPPPKDDFCAVLTGGHKVCRNTKGQNCVISGNTGRKYCPAGDGAINGTNPNRTENVSQSAPAGPPGGVIGAPQGRPGENFTPQASFNTTTNNTTNNTTNVTNTQISGNTGTPNTAPGAGAPNDGSTNTGTAPGGPGNGGPGEEGEGEQGEDDKATATGGGCGAGWAATGDAILAAILKEQHESKCQGEKANDDLDAMEGTSGDDVDALEGLWGDGEGDPFQLDDTLISVGGGADLLPAVELEGRTWAVPQSFYDAVAQIRLLIIAVCTIAAALVVGRGL